jgi:CBS domain containing-hemolysin-like protein
MLALQVIGVILLLGANAFFVASEFALARLREERVQELLERGVPGARALEHAVSRVQEYLMACQLGITMCSLGLGIVAGSLIARALDPIGDAVAYGLAFAGAFIVLTLLHAVCGELMPRSAAVSSSSRAALAVARPLRAFYLLTRPAVALASRLGGWALAPFGVEPAREVGIAPLGEGELRELLRHSRQEGLIDASDVEYAEGVFTLGNLEVKDVMVPRPDVVALSVALPTRECLASVVDSPYTRYPVYRGSVDEIVGILHVRDLFAALYDRPAEQVDVEALLRDPYVVPETKDLAPLLGEFRKTNQHMAVVVDEYGTFSGIVTLEDLLEEIVGEIEDEYDLPDASVERLPNGRLRVHGSFTIDDFNEQFSLDLPQNGYQTIGGFVFGRLGRQPVEGDEVSTESAWFRVIEVTGSRIDRLEVEFPSSPAS